MDHHKNCELCDILFPGSNNTSNKKNGIMPDETLYKILRDEMMQTFTRVANARNWVLVIFAGALGSVSQIQSKGVNDHTALIISFIFLGATLFTFLFSHFANRAYADSSEIGLSLLVLESINSNHHWNEHFSWLERLKSRNISNRKSWLIYRKKRIEYRLHFIKDIIYDFYCWISGILLSLQFINYSYHPTENILQINIAINFLLFLFILLITFSSSQNYFYYLKNAGFYYYQYLNYGFYRKQRLSDCILK